MPAAVSIRERQAIIEMRQQGHRFTAIAKQVNRSYETVRKLYHRYVQSGQLEPSYEKCRHRSIRKDEAIYRCAIDLKQGHPTWGAGLIWVELAETFAEADLPSERTLQRWFRRGGVQNPAVQRRPHPFAGRGKGAHEVWAMDAKEQVELGEGTFVSWLTLTDEGSGAIVGAFLFPLKHWGKIDPMLVKAALQELMGFWGRPERIRMDNGTPWGTASPLPSALALWLVGLGIKLIYGRRARSTDNAVVERSHGVLDKWIEAQQCVDFAACEQRLAWAVHTQRERFRVAQGQSRIQKYPDLVANPRGYDPQHDSQAWSRYRLRHYLSGFSFQRKVEKNGRITLFTNTYSVSRHYARRYVEVHIDAVSDYWIICDEYGEELPRHPAKELSYEQISQLRLAKRRRL